MDNILNYVAAFVSVITLLSTIISGVMNYKLTKKTSEKQIDLDKEISLLEHFEKKKNALYKIILVYRQDQRKRIDNYGSNYVGYENKQITGDGLDKEDADQIVLIMSDQSLIFDSEIIDQFDKTYSEYIEKVSKRYYQEESDLELAQENELFYFHEFDESKDFYKLVIEKDEFYSGKLS